jgi:hypothetical protein
MKPVTLPSRPGVGFKPEHFAKIIAEPQPVGFFEVHAENYMGAGGPPHAQLGKLREDYALSIHGVGLSIGSMQTLDEEHLARLKALCDRYEPESFSEHLAWSTHDSIFLNDLLPLPYTNRTLSCVCDHIDRVQEVLKRQMLLENPATYLLFEESTLEETAFLTAVVERTGCGLLLDINNVFVASTNHNMDPKTYLERFPIQWVREVHLSGHSETVDDLGAQLLIDSHDTPVKVPVWSLYEELISSSGPVATLIEWDNDVPAWPALRAEAEGAAVILEKSTKQRAA